MSEPIYREPGLVVTDGDRLLIVGPPAGPAGSSIVELPDGSSWQVDHADPSVPILLELDAHEAGRSPLLTTAFGGDEAPFLVEDAVALTGDGTDGHFLEGQRPERPRHRAVSRRPVREWASEAGEMVLLGDLASDRLMHPLTRLAAALEFVLSVDRNAGAPALNPLAPTMLASVEDMGGLVDDAELAMLDGRVLSALERVCRQVQKTTRRVPPMMRDLVDRIDNVAQGAFRADEHPVASLLTRMETIDAGMRDEGLLAAAPPPPSGPSAGAPEHPVLRRIGDALVNVTVARSDTERWTRVFHRRGMVLLGQEPLRRDGLVDVAEVVVPADVRDEDLDVLVTDNADIRALVDRPIDLIRAAVAAGREAARAVRLGNASDARIRWERCAELWIRAGDPQRSDQAYELAADPGWAGSPRSSTADEIAELFAPVS